ncbi:sister chromatid cohesion 1 protein 2-like [Phalaenopsis equestris]|uniref:sister chromatid cohesion 1 protein 2-like n=1 Tax=Phalaenopsis equestris TaxID=78828 RepID=UPI0009E2742E|nr:sister chromatid cohesion 1 protein 2-like [Phalaenopsis equestris]
MFYSLSLLSRKGPLGTIWIAAYCFKKLKRGQIASTDISSTVDKIMPEIQISHRVLAQLLLGIVKIFSKKVDFLYDECNETLNQIRKSLLVAEGNNAQNKVSARPRKGNRCSKEVKSAIDHIAMTMKEHSCEKQIETMLASYHEVSVPLPEQFELGSFDFGVLEEGDIGGSRQHPTPLGEWQDNRTHQPSYLDECLTNEVSDLSDYKSSRFTPLADILPSCTLDVDLELSDVHHESSNFSNVQRSLEQFHPGGDIEKEVCLTGRMPLNDKIEEGHIQLKHQQTVPSVRDEILSVEEQKPITEILNLEGEMISSMMDVDFVLCETHNSNKYASVPISSVECPHGGDFKKQVCLSGSLPLLNVTEEIHIPLNNEQTELSVGDKNHLVEGRRNPTETINLQGELTPESGNDNIGKRHADALPPDKQKPNISASPKFMLATPANKESSRVLRKRKKDYDKSIILSNKFMKQIINDASDLVCKRRKLPHIDLDIWKFRRFSNPSQSFKDPLIPFSSPVQEKPSQKKLPKLSKNSVELIDSPNVKDGMTLESSNAEIDTEISMQKRIEMPEISMQKLVEMRPHLPKESAVDHIDPTNKEDSTPHINAEPETEALIQKLDLTCQTPSNSSDCRSNCLKNVNEEFTLPDAVHYQLEKLELCFHGDDIGEQANGWPPSTRVAAQYLYNRFLRLREKEVVALSLTEILEGKTRATRARFMYETLTLKTYGCIDVRQDFPYGDVSISATPVLESFQKVYM